MGIMASIQDRVLLLLSIKEEGKKIDFEHIMEKICKDLTSSTG